MQKPISSAIKKYWYMFLPAQLLIFSFQYLNNTIVQLALYIIAVALVSVFLKRKFPEIFQNKQRPSLKNIIEIIMLLWLGRVITVLLYYLINIFYKVGVEDILDQLSWWDKIYLAVLAAPVTEEAYFRGIALQTMLPLGATNAFLISSLMFSLPHSGFANIVSAFLGGFLLSYAAYKYGIIWSVFFHALENGFSVFLSYLITYDRAIFTIGNHQVFITHLLGLATLLATIVCMIYFGKKISKNRHHIKGFWEEYKPKPSQLVEILKNPWMISFVILHLLVMVFNG